MIREDKFVMSHRPYAVAPYSLAIKLCGRPDGSTFYSGNVRAVWFRRRSGVTVACTGSLWDYQDEQPRWIGQFLQAHTDGRYGGTCDGRWDGERYWGKQHPDDIATDLELLRPMLANFPAIPDGWDGWWTFRTPR